MAAKALRLAGTAALMIAQLVPAAANAQYYNAPTPHYVEYRGAHDRDSRAGDGEPARDGYDRDHRDTRRARAPDRRCERSGTLLGAIAGGLLGNAAVGGRANVTTGHVADRDC